MTLEDIIIEIDRLSRAELRELREHIQDREQALESGARRTSMTALLAAFEEIRAGLSEEEFAEIEQAMNYKTGILQS